LMQINALLPRVVLNDPARPCDPGLIVVMTAYKLYQILFKSV
jgi:hypothetical protein